MWRSEERCGVRRGVESVERCGECGEVWRSEVRCGECEEVWRSERCGEVRRGVEE